MSLFFTGLIVGVIASAALWGFYFFLGPSPETSNVGTYVVVIVLMSKVIGGIILACIRSWRAIGAGLLASLPLGIVVWGVMCSGAISAGRL